jgi:acyl-CoA synthetase (AMP-forming)/AMP-acid ligase II
LVSFKLQARLTPVRLTELPRNSDSEHSVALPESILHAEADRPSISLNKAGLQRLFQEFAFGLRKRFAVGANGRNKDVVVVFSTGQVAYPAAFFGIIGAGGVASLASASYTAFELARQVKQGGANILISSPDLLDVARDAASQVTERNITVLVLRTEPDFSLHVDGEGEEGELRGQTIEERLPWERITDMKELENSLIALLYSSGTTGEPKGTSLHIWAFILSSNNTPSRRYAITPQLRSSTDSPIQPNTRIPNGTNDRGCKIRTSAEPRSPSSRSYSRRRRLPNRTSRQWLHSVLDEEVQLARFPPV